MKKIYILVAVIIFLVTQNNIKEVREVIETVSEVSKEPRINSRYAIVLDRQSKTILYGKNEKTKTKMASTTKIMTAMVVICNTNLDNVVEISKKAAGTGGSRLKIKAGDKISVRDLLYGLLLRSGNDAAVALAEYVGESTEKFAILMNQKAKEIGLRNTNFVTPHGLDSEEHYTTAYELALLTDYALKNQVFSQIVNTKSCTININGISRIISNTNELLGYLNGVYGVKTGFTNGAGRCLVTSIKREDLDIICVVLGADTKKDRTRDSVKLIEYTFNTYQNINLHEKIKEEFENWKNINKGRINIKKGKKYSMNIKLAEYNLKNYPIKKGTDNKIEIKIESNLILTAPVEENSRIGKVTVFYDNNTILEIDILTVDTIEKKGIGDHILDIMKNYNTYVEKIIE